MKKRYSHFKNGVRLDLLRPVVGVASCSSVVIRYRTLIQSSYSDVPTDGTAEMVLEHYQVRKGLCGLE